LAQAKLPTESEQIMKSLVITAVMLGLYVFTLAGATEAQTAADDRKAAKQKYDEYAKKGLIWQYDRFRDETTIFTKPQVVQKPGLFLSALADAAGSETSAPMIVMLSGVIYNGARDPNVTDELVIAFQISANAWRQLKSDHEVRVLFEDGEVIKLGKAKYEGDIQQRSSLITKETMIVPIERANLARLASAKLVRVQIGRMDFAIKDQHLKTLSPCSPCLRDNQKQGKNR
jgi:hypothetical protein